MRSPSRRHFGSHAVTRHDGVRFGPKAGFSTFHSTFTSPRLPSRLPESPPLSPQKGSPLLLQRADKAASTIKVNPPLGRDPLSFGEGRPSPRSPPPFLGTPPSPPLQAENSACGAAPFSRVGYERYRGGMRPVGLTSIWGQLPLIFRLPARAPSPEPDSECILFVEHASLTFS